MESQGECRPHSSLYYPDGDIILSARKSFGADAASGFFMQLFRVDKIYLSRNSSVFADMFSLPIPEHSDQEMMDGVPVVALHDDADDVEALISVLYSPGGLVLERHSPYTPLSVAPLLRMSTKYEVDRIRDIIVSHLNTEWPQSLDEWDLLQHEVNWYKTALQTPSGSRIGKIRGRYLDDWFPEPAAAIKVAMDFDIPSILPSAFYQLYLTDPAMDFEVCRVPLRQLGMGYDELVSGGRSARWSLLMDDDRRRLEEGGRRIGAFFRSIPDALWAESPCQAKPGCSVEESCRILLGTIDLCRIDVLWACWNIRRGRHFGCSDCREHLHSGMKRLRLEFWNKLPEIFNLPIP